MIPQLDTAKVSVKLIALAVAVLVLLGAGFAGGCRWQKSEVVEAEAAQHDAERDRDGWKNAATLWEVAIKEQNKANAKAREDAAKDQQRVNEAVDRANKAADLFLKRRQELEREHARDQADPDCAAQMRRPVCGSPLR